MSLFLQKIAKFLPLKVGVVHIKVYSKTDLCNLIKLKIKNLCFKILKNCYVYWKSKSVKKIYLKKIKNLKRKRG